MAASGRPTPGAILLTAALVVAADQATKSVALEALEDGPVHVWWTLRLALTYNRGIAFSLAEGLTPVITAMAVALVVALLLATRRVRGRVAEVALGLVIGGAVGNLTDRLVRGHGGAVVDFIDLQWWPVFNVADAALTCGAVALALAGLRDEEPESRA